MGAGTGEELPSDAIIPLTPEKEDDGADDVADGGTAVAMDAAPQAQQGGGNTFEIHVDMSPVIKIEGDGMDEQKIFDVLQARIREMADELGDEIAERMGKIFANMPLVQEA